MILHRSRKVFGMASVASLGLLGVGVTSAFTARDRTHAEALAVKTAEVENDVTLVNWSATHSMQSEHLYQPESARELVDTVKACQKDGTKLRPLGSGLSPNGIGFSETGVLSMALLDKVCYKIEGEVFVPAQ